MIMMIIIVIIIIKDGVGVREKRGREALCSFSASSIISLQNIFAQCLVAGFVFLCKISMLRIILGTDVQN